MLLASSFTGSFLRAIMLNFLFQTSLHCVSFRSTHLAIEFVHVIVETYRFYKMITFYGFKVNKPLEVSGKARPNSVVYYDKEGLWKQIFDAFKVWGITGNAYFYDNVLIIDYKNKVFRVQ